MNAAEIKLDLFRKIDNISESELKKVYSKLVAILNSTSSYKVSEEERAAIEEALVASDKGEIYSRKEVVEEANRKYPNLNFNEKNTLE